MGTSEGAKKSATPEARSKRAEAMRRKWAEPGYREQWIAARRGTGPRKKDQPDPEAEKRPGPNKWTPEKRAAFSERMKERAADPEVREKLSKAGKERWAKPDAHERATEQQKSWREDPEKKANHLAAMRTPERRAAASAQMKAQWAEIPTDERRRKTARMRNSFKGGHKLTVIEALVITALNELDAWYRVHYQVDGYTADILVQPDLIIECDGAWFHDQRKDTDAVRDARLAELGYRTLRLNEAEINDGTFVAKLREALGMT